MEGQILAQRQALSGIASSATSVIGNIGDAASSAASAVSSVILTSKTSSTSASTTSSASSASNTSNTSSSSSSTTSSSSSSSPTSSVSASETLSTALSSSSSDSATSSSPSVSESVYETTSDGVEHTVTAFASAAEESATGSSSSAATQTGATHKSFLQNKPLSGFVFALCGIVGLVLILLVVTFTLRRRRKNKLLNEAISFDPQGSAYHPDRDMEEKLTHQRTVTLNSIGGSVSGTRENGSSTGHGMYMPPAAHGYYDAGYSGQTGNAYTYAAYAPTRSEARNPSYDHLGVTHNMGSLAFENRSMSPPRSQVPATGPPMNNLGQNYAYGTSQQFEGR
ncbi:hypothetical protein ARMGADRAFT_1005962 [Armillaria gallica]|uniref:REJ domain-containing protein n=1 Tax=Armillaria gallica TaxID=47427 RepID=A0A2H3E5E6_ARMGA|nr:hypothetical protein ARMGADRAFT_1005962 [Armillaria gallica]